MTKDEMEMHKKRTRRQSCGKVFYSIPEQISKGVEHFFYR